MNLAQMLATTVTPLSAHEPSCQKRQRAAAKAKREADKQKAPRKVVTLPRKRATNVSVKDEALSTYRAEWRGEEWLPTAVLRARLARGRSSCLNTLRKWESQGLIESRNILGKNGRPRLTLGVEWRWK